MPKSKGKKQVAAAQQEAAKRGETIGASISVDPDVLCDPTYEPCAEVASDMETLSNIVTAAEKTELLMKNRKERHDNADILPERFTEASRTTVWRNTKGKTKKARAVKMQYSVLSYFSKKDSTISALGLSERPLQLPEEDEGAADNLGLELFNHEPIAAVLPGNRQMLSSNTAAVTIDVDKPIEIFDVDKPTKIINVDKCVEIIDVDVFEHLHTGTPECQPGDTPLFSAAEYGNVLNIPHEPSVSLAEHLAGPIEAAPGGPDIIFSNSKNEKVYLKLKRTIEKLRKKYRSKKTVLTNDNASSKMLDLEAISQYNDMRFKHQTERNRLRSQIMSDRHKIAQQHIRKRIARIHPAMDASTTVAYQLGKGLYYARVLCSMANELLATGMLPESRQGKGAVHASYLLNPKVTLALQEWVKGTLLLDEGGFIGQLSPLKLRRYVNDFLFPQLHIEDTICESTAIQWLKRLGFNVSRVQKGVYVDGHERPDVVESRKKFITYINDEVLPYDGDNMSEAPPARLGKQHNPIFYDETCIHANDLSNYVWMREGEQPLRNKSRGRIVHVSDFIIEASGRLNLNDKEIAAQMKLPIQPSLPGYAPPAVPSVVPKATGKRKRGKGSAAAKNIAPAQSAGRTYTEQENEWVPPPPPAPFSSYRLSNFDARRIIYPGANYDPWWDMPQLISQTKDAINIFNTKFPDGVAVFIFDCSSAHEAFASDALIAHKMNRGPGGKQPKMRDTVIPETGRSQSMVYSMDYDGLDGDGKPLAGQPKGMEQILRERNLLHVLDKTGRGGTYVGVCADCKKSQAAREAALKEARAKQDEVEGSGIAPMAMRGISDFDETDWSRSTTCCMQRVLSLQKDFVEEKPLLQLIIERAGHKCIFLPKFHCKLNPIEMVWGQTKQKFRGLADGTFKTAQRIVPECLESVTTTNIRRYFRHCWRYMDAYSMGLNLKQAAYAVKKYKSHRRVPCNILMDVAIITRGLNG